MLHLLVEGTSDVPTVREVMVRGLGRVQGSHFQIYWHRGKGRLPSNIHGLPELRDQTLLGQLPAKLRAFGKGEPQSPVLVLIDADRDNCVALKASLLNMLNSLTARPQTVIFRIAVEEIESWFIADVAAVMCAYTTVNSAVLNAVAPDAVVGAWETLATALGVDPNKCSGADKEEWAKMISPYLNLDGPSSPSFRKFIEASAALSGTTL